MTDTNKTSTTHPQDAHRIRRTAQKRREVLPHTSWLAERVRLRFLARRMKTPQRALLVVDDDPDIRETVADVLRNEGRTVTTASDGFDALQKLGQLSRPCFVLLDLMMPRMSGLEFLTHLSTRPESRDVDVVVMSAHDALRREAQQFPNVRATVRKPFDIEELLSLVSGQPSDVTAPSELEVTRPELPERLRPQSERPPRHEVDLPDAAHVLAGQVEDGVCPLALPRDVLVE